MPGLSKIDGSGIDLSVVPVAPLSASSGAFSGNVAVTGSLGVGNASPTYKMDVTGVIRATSEVRSDIYMLAPAMRSPSGLNSYRLTGYQGNSNGAQAANDLITLSGMGGSNGYLSIEMNFAHSGGGSHGGWARYTCTLNAYVAMDVLQNVQVNYGGGLGYTFSRPTNDTFVVRWGGNNTFSTAYSFICNVYTNRTPTFTAGPALSALYYL
jgi:hypothetical protein